MTWIMFLCLLGDAYWTVWLLSVILQLLCCSGITVQLAVGIGGRDSLSQLHLKLHLILSRSLSLFLAAQAGTVLPLFKSVALPNKGKNCLLLPYEQSN